MIIQRLAVASVVAGLLAAGSIGATAGRPATTTAPPVLAAFSAPVDKGHDWHGHGGDRGRHDGDRGRHDGDHHDWGHHDWGHHDWDHHNWGWRDSGDWGISAWLCRDGGGHVDWSDHRCDGGRFDDFRVR